MKSPRRRSCSRSSSDVSSISSEIGSTSCTVTSWTSAETKWLYTRTTRSTSSSVYSSASLCAISCASEYAGLSLKPPHCAASSKREKRSVEIPLRPTGSQRVCTPSACTSRCSATARRRICALNAPASPRSPVTGTIATVRASRRCSSGSPRTDALARAVPAISSSIRSAYGRMASIRSCARRRRADATSSIAFVSLRVFVIARTRVLSSWTVAIGHLRRRSRSLAAKSKRCKEAGCARSRRLRAHPRTRQRAALQRPSECEIRRRGPSSRDQPLFFLDVEAALELVELPAQLLLSLVVEIRGLADLLVDGALCPQVLAQL